MDENEITSTLERASLLKNRWYLIFKQGDDDEHVSMTAYDTTEEDEDDFTSLPEQLFCRDR